MIVGAKLIAVPKPNAPPNAKQFHHPVVVVFIVVVFVFIVIVVVFIFVVIVIIVVAVFAVFIIAVVIVTATASSPSPSSSLPSALFSPISFVSRNLITHHPSSVKASLKPNFAELFDFSGNVIVIVIATAKEYKMKNPKKFYNYHFYGSN